MAGDSRREALGLQLGQTAFHLGPDLDDVAARSRCDGDAERTLALVGHLVAHGFGVAVLHARDVAQPQLVVLVPLDDHALDLLHGAELVGDSHADAVGPVVVISGIVDVVLPVERRQRLGRTDAEHRHLFGQDRNVDALLAFAVDLDTRHTVQIAQLAFEQAGIIRQLPLRKTVARERIEHSVDQSEVVLHDDRRSRRQSPLDVGSLAAQHVPALFDVGVAHRAFQLHLQNRQIVERRAGHALHLAHGADVLLQRIGHLQLHFMRRSAGARRYDHRQLDLDFGVFELRHVVGRKDAADQKDGDDEIDELPIGESPFPEIDHNNPPTFVFVTPGRGATFSPSRSRCTPDVTIRSPGRAARICSSTHCRSSRRTEPSAIFM